MSPITNPGISVVPKQFIMFNECMSVTLCVSGISVRFEVLYHLSNKNIFTRGGKDQYVTEIPNPRIYWNAHQKIKSSKAGITNN